jgi:hypothetical protein
MSAMILDNKTGADLRVGFGETEKITLWRFNKITGFWLSERICEQATAEEWLEIFQKDKPNEIFVLSLFRPKKAPESKNARARIKP